MMQYMMIFMGIMFYKVACGLCVYFIASSIWSVAERKMLPKAAAKPGGPPAAVTTPAAGGSPNGAPTGKKRQRGRR
jgi:YidC/Oxa1 family membrane protein insertase